MIEFRKKKGIEQRKEKIKREAIKLIEGLEGMENMYKQEGVLDKAYEQRQESIKGELKDFILEKVDEDAIDSIEDLLNLERISEENEKKINTLCDEYYKKLLESEKLQKDKEKKRSDQLLSQEIDIPLVPDLVREYIKSSFTIKTEEEATIVKRAIYQWVQSTGLMNKPVEYEQKMWRGFIVLARDGGWDYLNKLASEFQEGPPHA